MAFYPSLQDYLYDQFYLPMKKAFKEKDEEEFNHLLDFICQKYIEQNAYAKGFEDYCVEKFGEDKVFKYGNILEWHDKYVAKYQEMKPWEDCITIYSEEEEKEN